MTLAAVFFVLYNPTTFSFLLRTVQAPSPPANSLKASILNVTNDFSELTHLLGEFFKTYKDPHVEAGFKQFLAERAVSSYPQVESILDWLLSLYKFVFPFLLISFFGKSGGAPGDSHHTTPQLGSPTDHKGYLASGLERTRSRSPAGPSTPTEGGAALPPHPSFQRQSSKLGRPGTCAVWSHS